MKRYLSTSVFLIALIACGQSQEHQLAEHRFEIPTDLKVIGPEVPAPPGFDAESGIWVEWPDTVTDSPLQYVQPLGQYDGPTLRISADSDVTFFTLSERNDPELGYDFQLTQLSQVDGFDQYEHVDEGFLLREFYDAEDRVRIMCNLDRHGEGGCYASALHRNLVIHYEFDHHNLENFSQIDASVVETVAGWIQPR